MHRVVAVVVLVFALTAAPLAHGGTQAKKPGILYSLDAKGPVIAQSGTSLRLSMPANTPVTWFTDRPDRRAGTTNLRNLAAVWDASGFTKDPPNAALLIAHKGEERTHVVTLRAPRVTGGRVSFALREIPNGTEAGHRTTHDVTAGRYGRARLFIDDAALSPCGASLRWIPPKLGTTPTPTLPIIVQCLLAPGASVAAYPYNARYMGSVWACRAGSGSEATILEASTSLAPYGMNACGGQTNPFFNGDFWLGTVNAGACTSTTSPVTATNRDAIATVRISILLETPFCESVQGGVTT